MKFPTESPLWVEEMTRLGDGAHVMLGALSVTQRDDPLDRRVSISFLVSVPDSADFSEGFHRTLATAVLHHVPRDSTPSFEEIESVGQIDANGFDLSPVEVEVPEANEDFR